MIKYALSFVLLLGLCLPVFGQQTKDGLLYKANSTGGLTVLGSKAPPSDLVIPPKIGDKNVTELGPNAFAGNKLTSVVLPEGLLIIGEGAFKGQSSIKKMNIPDSVTAIGAEAFRDCVSWDYEFKVPSKLESLGIMAFYGDTNLRGDLVFPDSLTAIPDFAFYGCVNMRGKLTLGSKTSSIGRRPFGPGLTGELVLPQSLESIGDEAFSRFFALSGKISLPKNLKRIGAWAFFSTNLTGTIELPDTLLYLGDFAFSGMRRAEFNRRIPPSLAFLGYRAFSKTMKEPVELAEGMKKADFIDEFEKQDIPKTADPNLTFALNKSGTYTVTGYTGRAPVVVIPAVYKNVAVTELGKAVFKANNSVANVVMPESLTVIGESAFEFCLGLNKSFKLPSSLVRIENDAFRYSSLNARDLVLPAKLESIGSAAFLGSRLYGSLILPDQVASIGNEAFLGCESLVGTLGLPARVKTLGVNAFRGTGFSGSLVLPEGLESVGEGAFSSSGPWSGKLSLPSTLKLVPVNFLAQASGLTEVKFPEGLVEIGQAAFTGVASLTVDPSFPSTLLKIGQNAFSSIKNAAVLEKYQRGWNRLLGDNRDVNGVLVGPNSKGTTSIYGPTPGSTLTQFRLPVSGEIGPGGASEIASGAFKGDARLVGVSFAYYADLQIGDSAFADCKNLTAYVTLDDNVKSLGKGAFSGCDKVTAFIFLSKIPPVLGDLSSLPTGVPIIIADSYLEAYLSAPVWKDLGRQRFNVFKFVEDRANTKYEKKGSEVTLVSYNGKETFLKIPDTIDGLPVTEIAPRAFMLGVHTVMKVGLPQGLKKIGDSAFDSNLLVGDLVIPEGVSEIGSSSFQDQRFLNKVVLPASLLMVSRSAFERASVKQLVLPDSLETIGPRAFANAQLQGDLKLPDSLKLLDVGAFEQASSSDAKGLSLLNGTLTLPKTPALLRGGIGGLNAMPFKKVICQSPVPYKVEDFGTWRKADTIFYVPSFEALAAYKADPNWGKIKNYQVGTGK